MSFSSIPADDDLSWINDALATVPQGIDLFPQDATSAYRSSADLPSLDLSSGDLPAFTYPTRNSASPSPVSLPSSPLVSADHNLCGVPLAYLSLNNSSAIQHSGSTGSMPTSGPFSQIFDGLSVNRQSCRNLHGHHDYGIFFFFFFFFFFLKELYL